MPVECRPPESAAACVRERIGVRAAVQQERYYLIEVHCRQMNSIHKPILDFVQGHGSIIIL